MKPNSKQHCDGKPKSKSAKPPRREKPTRKRGRGPPKRPKHRRQLYACVVASVPEALPLQQDRLHLAMAQPIPARAASGGAHTRPDDRPLALDAVPGAAGDEDDMPVADPSMYTTHLIGLQRSMQLPFSGISTQKTSGGRAARAKSTRRRSSNEAPTAAKRLSRPLL